MAGRHALRALGVVLMAAALLAASCGSNGGSTTVTVEAGAPAQDLSPQQSDPVRIRLALAPDPVWEWLQDSGTVAQWEASHNIRIEASSPFDQFAAFAGGHVDVVVVNALEVPQFVEQSDREPSIVGKFTTDRSILAVRRTSRAETLDDLVEARIAVESSLGSTLLWGLIAESLHGLDLRVDSPDFELVVVDPASVADLVMREDVDACICVPDFSVPYLAGGTMRALYGGRSAAEVYAEDVLGEPGMLPMADAFLVDAGWHHRNEDAVASLLGLWDAGLSQWKSDLAGMVADYPHLFSVTDDDEIAWIADYTGRHDWVASSVYINQDEADMHYALLAEMQRVGLLDADAALPELDTLHSPGADGHDHSDPDGAGHHSAERPAPDRPEPTRG